MALGLIAYDLIFLTLATTLYGGAVVAAVHAFHVLSAYVPWPLALFPALVVGLFALVLEVAVLTALCPRLRPGRYTMMKGAVFYGWLLRSALRRLLFVPGLKWFLFSSNVLRFLTLRGLGAKVGFTTNMSADVDLLDPSLMVVGPGAMIGARCFLSGHYVEDGKLVLGEIHVGERSLLAFDVKCGPNVRIGARVMVKASACLSLGVTIGDDAQIGAAALLDTNVVVGPKAIVANAAILGPRTEVVAGGTAPRVARGSE